LAQPRGEMTFVIFIYNNSQAYLAVCPTIYSQNLSNANQAKRRRLAKGDGVSLLSRGNHHA
jgi:hypothetical protein